MSSDSRRKTLLVLLGFLLLVAAWRSLQPLLRDGEPMIPTAAVHPQENDGQSGLRPGDRLTTLRTADLDRIPSGSAAPGRDLWRFIDPPSSPPSAIEPVHRALPTIPPKDPVPLGSAATAAPAPPELSLEYLGNFGPPQRKIAVFSDGKGIYNAQEGDVIDGRFIVARIGYESVDVRFVGFPDAPAKRVGVRHR